MKVYWIGKSISKILNWFYYNGNGINGNEHFVGNHCCCFVFASQLSNYPDERYTHFPYNVGIDIPYVLN